jgi:hypothetical protein
MVSAADTLDIRYFHPLRRHCRVLDGLDCRPRCEPQR